MELTGQELRGISSKLSTEERNAIFKKVKALLSKKKSLVKTERRSARAGKEKCSRKAKRINKVGQSKENRKILRGKLKGKDKVRNEKGKVERFQPL